MVNNSKGATRSSFGAMGTSLSVLMAAVLSACGGGGTTGSTLSGAVMDGYLKGATVCLDTNGNGACDTGEPSATTGDRGAYKLEISKELDVSALHLIAKVPATAIDEDTGAAVGKEYQLQSPAAMAAVVSPLTTVVSSHMRNGQDMNTAKASAKASLNITDASFAFDKDFVATQDTKAHNVAKVLARKLSLTGDKTATAVLSSVTAMASTLQTAYASTTAIKPADLDTMVGALTNGGTSTAGCSTGVLLCFDEATAAALTGFGGLEGANQLAIVTDPAGGNGKVLKVVKMAENETWAGVTLSTLANQAVTQIPLSQTKKTLTLRVYSPAAGLPVRLKLEDASDNTHTVEVEVSTTKANEWETLSFDFSKQATGTAALNLAYTFNKVSVFPHFGSKPSAAKTFYFDDLALSDQASGGGNNSTSNTAALVFASGYTAVNAADVGYAYQGLTTQGGAFNWTVANGATYGWGGSDFWWSGVASADAVPNFYWGGKGKSDQDYMESWVNAPSNATVTLTGQTKLRIAVWGNDQLVGSPRFTPVIQLAATNGCYPRAEGTPLTPVSAGADAATYNVALSTFTVVENCGTTMTTSAFMAQPIGSVRVRLYKANYYTQGDAPNGINLGPISFQP
ncbi:hypothetical protein [Limnohabitans sp. B9-3]|uniref:hypothetical protein n=1 Tax=Limnohabitans sp. B9-3 TaxID=1100707 RepID=UPI000C1E7732|nr:hypothetical protein [Limnohabitans sp. B9-3]PIT73614.1 hypothetical protein B9Z42_10375 [Limnohabitans sp. B9-3]